MARVSVLLPARNAAATLPAAVASISRQRFSDLEIVLVDDRSVDGTAELLDELCARERRLQVIEGPGDGIVAALEAGRRACTGELVARMDADDLAHPLRLTEQVARLDAETTLTGVGCRVALFPRAQVREGMARYVRFLNSLRTPEALSRARFIESPVVHPAVVLRAAALDEIGGYIERGWPEDYELFLRLFDRGHRLANLPTLRLFWREHAGRLTRNDPRYGKARHLALKAEYLAKGPLAAGRACAICGAGKTGTALARELRARGIEIERFFDVDQKKIGSSRGGAPILAYAALPPPGGPPLLLAIAARGVREQLSADLDARGYHEGVDYWACA